MLQVEQTDSPLGKAAAWRYIILHLCIISVVPAFVFVVDPHHYLPSITDLKKYFAYGGRIEKSSQLAFNDFDMLVVGTSRVQIGIDPEHPFLLENKAYNLGLPMSGMVEINDALRFAKRHQKIDRLVIGVDFTAFNRLMPVHHERKDSLFASTRNYLHRMLSYSFNHTSIVVAINSLWRNYENSPKSYSNELGFLNKRSDSLDHRKLFTTVMSHQYLTLPGFYAAYDYDAQAVSDLEEILERYLRDGVEVKLYTPPIHVQHNEALLGLGLLPQFESWKRDLTRMTQRLAEKTDGHIQLWDFNIYSNITMEDIPDKGDSHRQMDWYFESSHFKPVVGNLVIDTLFNLPLSSVIPGPLAIMLTTENIENHLKSQRLASDEYRRNNPDEKDEMDRLIRDSQKEREKNRKAFSNPANNK